MTTSAALARALGVGGQAGPLLHQGFGLLRAAVVDHDGVAGLQEIGGHGRPHDPQAHKPDFGFIDLSSTLVH